LELKADKTFEGSLIYQLRGTWSASGDRLSLRVLTVAGKDLREVERKYEEARQKGLVDPDSRGPAVLERPIVLVVSADGLNLTKDVQDTEHFATISYTKSPD
jgi:hypothetical protein